jgi:hypothetical protein
MTLDPNERRRRQAILRMLAYAAIVFALSVVAIIAIVSLVTDRAHGASLCERHGMQKVWIRGGRSWRCKRVRVFAAKSRVRQATASSTQPIEPIGNRRDPLSVKLVSQGDLSEPSIRLVRTVPIVHGLTPNERIERAFDKVMLFPVVDEP